MGWLTGHDICKPCPPAPSNKLSQYLQTPPQPRYRQHGKTVPEPTHEAPMDITINKRRHRDTLNIPTAKPNALTNLTVFSGATAPTYQPAATLQNTLQFREMKKPSQSLPYLSHRPASFLTLPSQLAAGTTGRRPRKPFHNMETILKGKGLAITHRTDDT